MLTIKNIQNGRVDTLVNTLTVRGLNTLDIYIENRMLPRITLQKHNITFLSFT